MNKVFLPIVPRRFDRPGFWGCGVALYGLLFPVLLVAPVLVLADESVAKKSASAPAAFVWYKEKAEQGDVEAQFNIGVMCETGWSVPVDNKKAIRWYREAAKQGNANAQIRLGMLYYLGLGARQSEIKGQKWIREAAEQNHLLAKNINQKVFGENVPDALVPESVIKRVRDVYLKDEKQALAMLDRLVSDARQQDARAKKIKEESTMRERRAQRLSDEPMTPGFSASGDVDRIKSVVPNFLGDASLQENRALVRGSVATIRLQAEKGLASAQYNLGRMNELGIKLPVDKQQALDWYEKAAKQGYPDAEYRLGIALLYGIGVDRDDMQGKKWLALAARHEHPVAKKMVEDMENVHGSANISIAANWYFERALEDDAESAFHLGKLYQYGWGVEPDVKEALKWYQRASSLGYAQAEERVQALKEKLGTQ
jgi:TPR repeat protein